MMLNLVSNLNDFDCFHLNTLYCCWNSSVFIIMSDYKGKPVAINVKPPPFTVKLQISFNVFSN